MVNTRHHENTPHIEAILLLDTADRRLLEVIAKGLPLAPRPYAEVGRKLGLTETEVIERVGRLQANGVIKRFGVVVRHRELGYTANAMVVFDVPEEEVNALGHCLAKFDFVTLCYRRVRAATVWPYNLYCMIHGKDRGAVLEKIMHLVDSCGLHAVPRAVLFSRRRFKQCGAVYRANDDRTAPMRAAGAATAPKTLMEG
jgi:siroheme decarboxylase